MPPCYDFTTSPFYSATTAQLGSISHHTFYFRKFIFSSCSRSVCIYRTVACFPLGKELYFLIVVRGAKLF